MKTIQIVQLLDTNEKDAENLTIDEHGKISDCTLLSQTERLNVHLPEKHRLIGIKISSRTGNIHSKKFSAANFSFVGDDENAPKIAYERINLSDLISFFVFKNLTTELTGVSIKLASTQSIIVCRLEIFVLPNQCGHPETPINGTVAWQRGSPTATYYCRQGFYLEPNTETRTCEKGKWSGTAPLCKSLKKNTFEGRKKETEDYKIHQIGIM